MQSTLFRAALLAGLVAAMPAPAAVATTPADPPLSTVAERSGFQRTGRYQETIELCAAFAQAYPDAVRCASFGTTPQGRPMQVLVATRSGAFDPDDAHARGLPVLLAQGGIHAGEIDGKDAGFLLLRQLLDDRYGGNVIERVWSIALLVGAGAAAFFGVAWAIGAIDKDLIAQLRRKRPARPVDLA